MRSGRMRWSLGYLALALITEGPCGAGSELRLGPSSLTWGSVLTESGMPENGSPVLVEVLGATKYSQLCSTWIFSPSEYSILIRSSTSDVGKCLDLDLNGLTNGRTNYQPLCPALGLSDLPGNRSQPLQPSENMTVPLNQPLLIREPMGSSCTSPHPRLIYLLSLPKVWLSNYC